MKVNAECGAIPAKLFEKIRPIAIAGFANDVEEVKKYALNIQRATPAGMNLPFLIVPS
jgi:hypothetical protein